MSAFRPALAMPADALAGRFKWSPKPVYALIAAGLVTLAIFNLHRQSEFLYFQF